MAWLFGFSPLEFSESIHHSRHPLDWHMLAHATSEQKQSRSIPRITIWNYQLETKRHDALLWRKSELCLQLDWPTFLLPAEYIPVREWDVLFCLSGKWNKQNQTYKSGAKIDGDCKNLLWMKLLSWIVPWMEVHVSPVFHHQQTIGPWSVSTLFCSASLASQPFFFTQKRGVIVVMAQKEKDHFQGCQTGFVKWKDHMYHGNFMLLLITQVFVITFPWRWQKQYGCFNFARSLRRG